MAEFGGRLVRLAHLGTGAIAATSVGAAAWPDGLGLAHAALACAMFAVGTGALLWAYALGVARSRTDDISVAGLFFLVAPVAPAAVRRRFQRALAIEVAVVVAAAAVRPFTVVAFGVLAPMFALGLMGLWGGRHATFPPRPAQRPA